MSGLEAHLVVDRGPRFRLDVELDIDPGETVALLGPNGSGKSTTVEALAGLRPLDAGHISLQGRVLDEPVAGRFVLPDQRHIGVVFQDYLLFDHLSVLDNVAFGPMARGRSRREARVEAHGWLERVDLAGLADRRPAQLSGGQAQRIALARALASDPRLVLLDEALGALDVDARGAMRRLLAEHLAAFDGPRLLITHDPTDAFLLADRIVVVENGTVTQSGTGEDIRRRPASPYVAAVAGTNLLTGVNHAGRLALDDSDLVLQTADTRTPGPVLVTVHPTAVAVHLSQPSGSPRNSWSTTVETIEELGDTSRLTLGDPLRLGVDITTTSTAALGLRSGSAVWVSVKATEVAVSAAPAGFGGIPRLPDAGS